MLDNGIIQAGVYAIIAIGAFVFILAALGLFGACCKSKILLGLVSMLMFSLDRGQEVDCGWWKGGEGVVVVKQSVKSMTYNFKVAE